MNRKTYLISAAVGLAVMVIMLLLLVYSFIKDMDGRHTVPGIGRISQLTGIRFPDSTRLINSELVDYRNQEMLMAKLGVDAQDVRSFLKCIPHRDTISRRDWSQFSTADPRRPWWNPHRAAKYVMSEDQDVGVRSVTIMLVDLDNSREAVIYLYWSAD